MPHVEEGQLHALLDGAFTEREAHALQEHIAACAECSARLQEERTLHDRSNSILALAQPGQPVAPPFAAVLERAEQQKTPARVLIPGPARLAWAATIVLALGMGWLARDFAPGGRADTVAVEEAVQRAPAPPAAPSSRAQADEPPADANTSAAEALTVRRGFADSSAGRGLAGRVAPERERADAEARKSQAAQDIADRAQLREAAQASGMAVSQQRQDAGGRPQAASPPALARATNALSAVQWEYVNVQHAEQRAGRAVLLVPGLELVNVGIAAGANGYLVRTTQKLPGDGLLEITQQPVVPAALADARREGAAEAEATAATSDGMGVWQLTVARPNLLLTGRATLPPDSLRALLLRARE